MAEKTISIADKPTLDEVKALLENSGYGLSALKSLLSAGSGAVKSVQRGTCEMVSNETSSKVVYISTVNTKKSILLVDNSVSGNHHSLEAVGTLGSSTINFYRRSGQWGTSGGIYNDYIAWQVIEFY